MESRMKCNKIILPAKTISISDVVPC